MCTYLAKRGATYYFRRVIPAELRPAFDGRSEFMISLRVKDRDQAKRLLAYWSVGEDGAPFKMTFFRDIFMQTNENDLPRRKSAAHLKAPASKAVTPPLAAVPQAPPSRKSIAGLTVRAGKAPVRSQPECRPPTPGRETAAVVERLRALRDSLPANQNDRTVVLIKACILEGICIDRRIVSLLVHLGFGNRYAGGVLHRHTLGKGSTAYWSRDANGRYHLLD